MLSSKMKLTRRQLLMALPAVSAVRLRGAEPSFECIDTHTHMHRSAPNMVAALEKANWRCLSICDSREVDDQPSILDEMIRGTKILHSESRGRIPWATTFDPRPYESADFAPRVVANLQRDFKDEAIAVKLWKNIGMAAHSKSGEYLMPDSKVLTPILEAVQKADKTLITHLAEPDAAWLPLGGQDSGYYRQHPEWHMYGKPQIPSKDAILQARDRMIARHPRLRVIGCHLGSNEEHLDQLAKRLDTLPNFAVDVASRVRYLSRADRETVRQFVTKYQDRIIYATDFTLGQGDEARGAASLLSTHEREWNYFSGTEDASLGLPEAVLKKIFHDNAARWIPGIA
jgi:predicted TIM-barrel fold metal-dependent hydrolase